MKNIFRFLMAALLCVGAASCTKENVSSLVGGEVEVTLTVDVPELGTRALGDGMTVDQVFLAVYEVDGTEALAISHLDGTDPIVNGKATMTVVLLKDKTYDLVFWAQKSNTGAYNLTGLADGRKVVANYGAKCNLEDRDAFFLIRDDWTAGVDETTFTLKRPFAQINVANSDEDVANVKANGVEIKTSALTVKTQVCNTLNMLTGGVENKVDVAFAKNDIPTDTFYIDGYNYLAMNYLLVNEKELVDLEFVFTDNANTEYTRPYYAVPVQRNYRTNILGQIISSPIDFTVIIDPIFEGEQTLNKVYVDGVEYTTLEAAIAKALELYDTDPAKAVVDFVSDYTHDADNTITIPEGKAVTLRLAGRTLHAVTDDADKNDDGKITSVDNEVVFDVRGTLNIVDGTITLKHIGDSYANFGWSACGEICYVGFNGVLNVNDAHLENFGGVPMAYAIDLVNAANKTRAFADSGSGVLLNVDNSTIKSAYIPVRVFNNGAGMNNVNITNTTLEGTSRAFWVHIHSNKDNNNKGVKDATLNLNIYNPECNNKFIATNPERIIEFGFDDAFNVDEFGNRIYNIEPIADGVGKIDDNTYGVTNANGLIWLAEQVRGGDTFETKTVKLLADIDLYQADENGEAVCFVPIGSYRFDTSFKGIFDGQNNTIKNLSQNTWTLDNGYYYHDCGLGLFGALEGATVKDLKIDNASISGESALCGVVAAAAHNTTFENITVSNSDCADYQYYSGGIVGWVSGKCTFTKCNVDESTTVAAQWGDFDNSTGGVIGGASGSAKILIKDCNVACRIDAYNDVTSTYQWYAYRRCGMLIGNSGKTETIDGTTYAAAPQLTCENVTVTYNEWANYTYCEFAGTSWPYVRVQAGVSNSAYSNPRYGHPIDANGNEVVDDNHVHNDGEDHHILCPFDQLYGGGQGVYGTPAHEGVTVIYNNK